MDDVHLQAPICCTVFTCSLPCYQQQDKRNVFLKFYEICVFSAIIKIMTHLA
jgi:hypothetical protein